MIYHSLTTTFSFETMFLTTFHGTFRAINLRERWSEALSLDGRIRAASFVDSPTNPLLAMSIKNNVCNIADTVYVDKIKLQHILVICSTAMVDGHLIEYVITVVSVSTTLGDHYLVFMGLTAKVWVVQRLDGMYFIQDSSFVFWTPTKQEQNH